MGEMINKGCGGTIRYAAVRSSYEEWSLGSDGELNTLEVDQPTGEVEQAFYLCLKCGSKWDSREEMMKQTQKPPAPEQGIGSKASVT